MQCAATSQGQAASKAAEWAKKDARRPLNVTYHVGDLQRHIDYYSKHFGMKLLRMDDDVEKR